MYLRFLPIFCPDRPSLLRWILRPKQFCLLKVIPSLLFLAMRQCPHCNYLHFWQMNTSASHRPLLLFFLRSKYWFYSREDRSVNVPSAQMPRFCRWLLFCTREDICSGTPQRHWRVVYCLLTSTLSFSTRAEDGRKAKKKHQKIQYKNIQEYTKKRWGQAQENYCSFFFESMVINCCFSAKNNGSIRVCIDYRASNKITKDDVYPNWWFAAHLPSWRVLLKPWLPLRILAGSRTRSRERKNSSIHARRSLRNKRDAILSVQHSSHVLMNDRRCPLWS